MCNDPLWPLYVWYINIKNTHTHTQIKLTLLVLGILYLEAREIPDMQILSFSQITCDVCFKLMVISYAEETNNSKT